MSEENNSLYENSEYPSRRRRTEPERRSSGRHTTRSSRDSRRSGGRMGLFWKALGTLGLVALCTGAMLCCFAAVYIKTVIVPEADLSMDDFPLNENSIMYCQDKTTGEYKEMVTLLNTTSSIWVDYDEIPKNLVNAAVAIEDKRFWNHSGVDWKRTANAVLSMFTGGSISGGSTITQQLIKNVTDYNETTVKRKVVEIVRALRFTRNNSKEDTITYYLNVIPLGSRCEGVGSASYVYFGKPVSELTLAECASLISITNNPSRYSPYSTAVVKNEKTGEMWDAKQWNKYRQEVVLGQMLDQGYITKEEYYEAMAQPLVFSRSESETEQGTVYSWYAETVIADVKQDLQDKLHWAENRCNQALAKGGLRIYTCMDPEVQAIAEKIYTDRSNLNYTSPTGQAMQSAITILDNSTGDVAAIVGQFGTKEKNLMKNFANSSKRQPGSSIKPLTVYSPALDMGLISPITVIDDYPYQVLNGKAWPTNSGSSRYAGKTTVRKGLTNSVNTISVRILADMVTPKASYTFATEKYHLDLLNAKKVGNHMMSDIDISPLAMGGLTEGLTTREMAQAYAAFPNGGVYTHARTYTKVTQMVDGQEVVLLENKPQTEQAIKETTAYYMNSMLQNVITSGTASGHGLKGMHAAGKTGSTNSNYDRWFVGYTPYYTAAVWTGYAQYNERMRTSGNPALNLWQKVMQQVHSGLADKSFDTPSGLVSVNYCLDSGLLATEYCQMDPRGSRVASDKIFQEDVPNGKYCTAHTADSVVKVCTDSPILNSEGEPTGLYHLAGPNCPESSVKQVCLPNYEREHIGGISAGDEKYRLSAVESYGTCTVHTSPAPVTPDPEEPVPDPTDPSAPEEPNQPNQPDHSNGSDPEQPAPPENGGETPSKPNEPPTSQDIRG